MNQVAAACGVSKATLYHYVSDKHALLAQISASHVARLEALVAEVQQHHSEPLPRLRELILRFVRVYADAQPQHRVLTEDVKFLAARERKRVLDGERRVVAAFADAVARLHPDLARAALAKPLTMLLFGMINWMFTWLEPGGLLSHDAMAPVVADLFIGGLDSVRAPGPQRRAKRVAVL
jgi:AcrR family transcriptional regulator